MAHTIKEKIAAAIKARGYNQVAGRSRKFDTYHKTNPASIVYKIFLGKSGSCRTGDTISKSHPISERAKLQMILEGEKILGAA